MYNKIQVDIRYTGLLDLKILYMYTGYAGFDTNDWDLAKYYKYDLD